MATFPIYQQLNQYTNQILEILNVGRFYEELKREFPPEYWLDCNFILEALDLASNISESNMARAPFPAIDISDTQADKAAKVSDTWKTYPAIGLQLYLDPGVGRWIPKGQPIVLQNTPVQFPIPLISPYLNARASVFLMGKTTRLGIAVVKGGNWQSIKGEDYITISGALRVDIEAKELKSVPIANWLPFGKTLISNQKTVVLPSKSNRRIIIVTNAGTSNIYCGFGGLVQIGQGILLYPGNSLTFQSSDYYIPSQFEAIPVNSSGLIVGQEGLI